ncbi:unnamed protein product [Staurois parvus]|uniref:Uncharacterized protein n=1 Tax=Staurois parvus TaxID=386267 RepID=A0ABN9H4U2_9NEOB|nr:unnamed protein product [Staurois parvus]
MASLHPACAHSPGVRSTAIRCSPDTVKHRSSDGTSVRGPDHVITDWPIINHMQSSKQDVTSNIIAYYV